MVRKNTQTLGMLLILLFLSQVASASQDSRQDHLQKPAENQTSPSTPNIGSPHSPPGELPSWTLDRLVNEAATANPETLSTVSENHALLLANTGDTLLYFTPNANYHGTISDALTLRAWDQTSGGAGAYANITATGGATAFSSVTDTAEIVVAGVNHAPGLLDTALTLTALNEDAGIPSGAMVGTAVHALTGGITDADSGAVAGIAVTAADTSHGSWYYTIDGGTSWTAADALSDGHALLLADNANTRVYFNPAADYNGTVTDVITIHAWDATSGTAGNYADVSTAGGTTAFSNASDTADLTVHAVNDAPTLTHSVLTLAAIEENAGAPVDGSTAHSTAVSALVGGINDVDSSALKGIAITAADTSHGTWHYTTDGGSHWSTMDTVSDSHALLLADTTDTLLYFNPAAGYSGTVSNGLTIHGWDTTSGTTGNYADTTAGTGGSTAFSTTTDTADISVTLPAPPAVIDLGADGKLILPIQVEGHTYYFWDRDGDGVAYYGDAVEHTTLSSIFTHNAAGQIENGGNAVGTEGVMDDTFRFATINGVTIALPTLGTATSLNHPGYDNLLSNTGSGDINQPLMSSTTVNDGTQTNADYNDLLAVWDAFNGNANHWYNQPGTPVSPVDGSGASSPTAYPTAGMVFYSASPIWAGDTDASSGYPYSESAALDFTTGRVINPPGTYDYGYLMVQVIG